MKEFEKTPNEDLDYGWDATDWLEPGDTIASVEWVVPQGITLYAQSHDDTECAGWFRSGTLGSSYIVVVRITTVAGRKPERHFKIRMVPYRSE